MKHSGTKYHLTVALQVILALVALTMTLSLYNFTERMVEAQCNEKIAHDIDRLRMTLNTELREVVTSTRSFANMSFENGHSIPHDTARIYAALERYLSVLPSSITGVVVGFEDSVFPEYAESNGLIALVRRIDGKMKRYQVGEKRDVRKYNNWYRDTKESESVRWSKPFLSEDGKIICSFCLPLYAADDSFAGVVAIDYSLEHLTQQITEYKPYPEASVAIIDEGLTYMASSEDSTAVLKETVFTRLSRGGLEVDTLVLNNVRAHRDGHTLIKQGSYQNPYCSYLYHSVVPNTGWTILMNCPETVLTELLTNYRLRMTFVAFTVCLLVIVVALSFMKYK